jgi:DNA-directed RNA polymerase specialized sigma subunit
MQAEIITIASGSNRESEPRRTLEDYLPLVRFLAESIQGGSRLEEDIDDLYAAGIAGLREAFATFKPVGRLRFETYAQLCVLAAIVDYARRPWDPANVETPGMDSPWGNSSANIGLKFERWEWPERA